MLQLRINYLNQLVVYSPLIRAMQIDNLIPLVTMLVCPDGWNEIHFIGQYMLLNNKGSYGKKRIKTNNN